MTSPAGSSQFAAPPRTVDAWLAARMLLGSVRAQIGWLILGFASLFFWAFAWNADLSAWRFKPAATGQVRGESIECRPTRLSEGGTKTRRGTPIYENLYRYQLSGQPYQGSSFATGTCLAGGPVTVEYLLDKPAYSRIAGMRRRPFGPEAIVVAVMPAIGIFMIVTAILRGHLHAQLLRDGLFATGKLVEKTRTNVQQGRRQVYRMTFEFIAQTGVTGRVTTRTSTPGLLGDAGDVHLLYDPANLKRAALLATLPGTIGAGETGQPIARGSALFWVLPALTILGNAWYVYHLQSR
ncbi:MAG TPA: hypothetical protein VKR61_17515 [Bryobacteraceae bacterium]|nr:hypothetical protein [Bryobacteraceae bacterium]